MSDTKIKIDVDWPNGRINITDPETDKPLLSVEAVVLTMTPKHMEAALIVDEPIIKGDWVIPVKEQMVISDAFTELLIDRIKSRLHRDIESLTDWYNRVASAEERAAKDLSAGAVDRIARETIRILDVRAASDVYYNERQMDAIVKRIEERMAKKLDQQGGVIS